MNHSAMACAVPVKRAQAGGERQGRLSHAAWSKGVVLLAASR